MGMKHTIHLRAGTRQCRLDNIHGDCIKRFIYSRGPEGTGAFHVRRWPKQNISNAIDLSAMVGVYWVADNRGRVVDGTK
jgi:hypothetical protein